MNGRPIPRIVREANQVVNARLRTACGRCPHPLAAHANRLACDAAGCHCHRYAWNLRADIVANHVP